MQALKFIVIIITATALLSFKQSHADRKITVVVSGLKNTDGNCIVNLYTKDEGFPNSHTHAYKTMSVKIKSSSAIVIFDKVGTSTYAVSVLHDANTNGVMDKNMFGIPKEGYGASNNILPSLSSPSFEDSKFEISNLDKTLVINVKY